MTAPLKAMKMLPREADDAMVKAVELFVSKIGYLSHPEIKWLGTDNGDTEEAWKRRLIVAAYAAMFDAAPLAPAVSSEREINDAGVELRFRIRHRDNWWILDCDERPGLYIAHADRQKVLNDLFPALEMLDSLDAAAPALTDARREGKS